MQTLSFHETKTYSKDSGFSIVWSRNIYVEILVLVARQAAYEGESHLCAGYY